MRRGDRSSACASTWIDDFTVADALRRYFEMAHAERHRPPDVVPRWPFENEREDAERWLHAHGSDADWAEIARVSGDFGDWDVETPSGHYSSIQPFDLVHTLSPDELVDAWEQVAGSADSDLTEEEWHLIVPHIGRHSNGLWRVRPFHDRAGRQTPYLQRCPFPAGDRHAVDASPSSLWQRVDRCHQQQEVCRYWPLRPAISGAPRGEESSASC